jgi:hypothetical protein
MTETQEPTTTQQADQAAEIRAAAEAIRLAITSDPTDEFAATCGVAMAELLEAHATAFDHLVAQFNPVPDWDARTWSLPSPAEEAALKLARAINESNADGDL